MAVLAGRALLGRVASEVFPVPVVALKGVVVSALAEGSRIEPRPMVDVDVLIPTNSRTAVEHRIEHLGLRLLGRTSGASTYRDDALGIDLDVHVRLCERGLFRFDEDRIIERATVGTSWGLDSLVPERHDLYAHLIAHFVRNRSTPSDLRRMQDFGIVAECLPMKPRRLADHLDTNGLGRAARLVLPWVGDALARETLAALPADPVGVALSRLADGWLRWANLNDPRAFPVPHALNHSLLAASRSATLHAVDAAKRVAGTWHW
jgi:hypothetical protein